MSRTECENLDGAAPLWRIPGERAKNGRAHLVPLSALAVEVLSETPKDGLAFTTTGDTPISGFSKAKENILRALAEQREELTEPTACAAIDSLLKDWRIHDFRRTAATCLAEIGTPRDVVEKILNHTSGTRSGVAGTYNRSELLAERRVALDLWAVYLQRITAECMSDRAIEQLRAELRGEYMRRLSGNVPSRPQLYAVAA